jgi:putative heme-binding domain-containing protein
MPHIGAAEVDREGLRLIHDWIAELPQTASPIAALQSEARSLAVAGNEPPPADGLDRALASPYLALAAQYRLLFGGEVAESWRQFARKGAAHPDPIIRDLFEQFLPPSERAERLGSVVDPAEILALSGDAARGRELFLRSAIVLCRNCHRAADAGTPLGPDLSMIGRQRTKEEILESILEPSRRVDPKYATWLLETKSGRVFTGLLLEQTAAHVALQTLEPGRIEVPTADVEQLVTQQRSLMPDLLFRELTPLQLADLLAWLATQGRSD